MMKSPGEPATEEVLVFRKDIPHALEYKTETLSACDCINDERALWTTPLATRPVYNYESCVDSARQHMQMVPKFVTPYYYVKVDTKEDGVCVVYRNGVRAVVDGIKQIGISLAWHDVNQFMHVANGDLSFTDILSEKLIKAVKANPLEEKDKGTWFILDAYGVDSIRDDAVQWHRSCGGAYFHGKIPGRLFARASKQNIRKIRVAKQDRYRAIGAEKLCHIDHWIAKRFAEKNPPKKLEIAFEDEISSSTIEQGIEDKHLIETMERRQQKYEEQKVWRGGYGSQAKYFENRCAWLTQPTAEVKLYNEHGVEVSCITERTQFYLAQWICPLCDGPVAAWHTVCTVETCAGVNPCVTR